MRGRPPPVRDTGIHLKNKVSVRVYGEKPVIIVYVNNLVEDPGETLRNSEQYKYFTEQWGSAYPFWKVVEAPGLRFKIEN